MKFRIDIDTSNAAFDGSLEDCAREIRRILKGVHDGDLVALLEDGWRQLRDVNGNSVGTAEYGGE